MSLSDKMRDEKRNIFKNLKILIIDEISLVDADMLHKIDLRLREVTQMGVPLGNIAIIVLGDLMQMCPISGRYIFLEPRNEQFLLSSQMDPLWRKLGTLIKGLDKKISERLREHRIYTLTQLRDSCANKILSKELVSKTKGLSKKNETVSKIFSSK